MRAIVLNEWQHQMEWIKSGNDTTKIFLPSRIHHLDKVRFEKWAEETGYTYTLIQIPPSQSLLDNLYRERRAVKELFYFSKDQYLNDVALLRRVKMCEQGRVPPEDITEEEGTSSSESDPEPDLNEDGDLYLHRAQKKSRPKQYTTSSGGITSCGIAKRWDPNSKGTTTRLLLDNWH